MDRATYVNELHGRYAVPEAVISSVVGRAMQGKVAGTERLIRGDEYEVHRVHLDGGSAVYLRAAWPDAPPQKVGQEAWAMEQARAGGVPVPEVLAVERLETPDGERAAMVLREAPGRQLRYVLPTLSPERRATALTGLGRALRILHEVAMPGTGRPDDHGRWAEPEPDRRRYQAAVADDTQHLITAGLSAAEVDSVLEFVRSDVVPLEDPPVLCHGDLSAEHVFVDPELSVTGLIDWGMWNASSAEADLTLIGILFPEPDLAAVAAGHGLRGDAEFRVRLCWHTITQATGQVRWLVVSGQSGELARPVAVIRKALSMITNRP
ncbi:phosphotransferase family protein [Microlunatus parietis]|uniref:Aminoglycoside phosphotransferase (APT) family kinase protein n=1 Tax=Microlunatus parietis TaxID=682979 RepID=A0A7Y9I7G7_9ACTN|nr:aminoglycoside phosphotransferase family protein [Microlunatus parietis]NYE71694.1 aminoglycoside phosphotransferase (APT) family kinase protein [Microlunatus parietis]